MRISFEDALFAEVEIDREANLSEALNASNSPVLFGCRSGICGTCLVEVEMIDSAALPKMDFIETESLELYAPGNNKARLACQLKACASMRLKKIR